MINFMFSLDIRIIGIKWKGLSSMHTLLQLFRGLINKFFYTAIQKYRAIGAILTGTQSKLDGSCAECGARKAATIETFRIIVSQSVRFRRRL